MYTVIPATAFNGGKTSAVACTVLSSTIAKLHAVSPIRVCVSVALKGDIDGDRRSIDGDDQVVGLVGRPCDIYAITRLARNNRD